MTLENGYETKTTFWNDFTIADAFGADAVKDTFYRAFNEWKSNYIYLTELVLILNLKIWQHYEHGEQELAKIYNDLWMETDDYAMTHLKNKDLKYFLEVLD